MKRRDVIKKGKDALLMVWITLLITFAVFFLFACKDSKDLGANLESAASGGGISPAAVIEGTGAIALANRSTNTPVGNISNKCGALVYLNFSGEAEGPIDYMVQAGSLFRVADTNAGTSKPVSLMLNSTGKWALYSLSNENCAAGTMIANIIGDGNVYNKPGANSGAGRESKFFLLTGKA